MHPAPLFRDADPSRLSALLRAHPLALVVAVADSRPVAVHAPVMLDDDARRLRFHLSRRNPVCAALAASGRALVIATGPEAYVSPDWYADRAQVPTWNYLSVEIEGPIETLDAEATTTLLDDLAARHEGELAPKPPWTRAKTPPDRFRAMLGAVTGYALTPERLEGVRKLGQNKSDADRDGVVAALRARGRANDRAVADAMAALKDDP